jgi:hypothetical protein
MNAMHALIEQVNDLGCEGWQLVSFDDKDRTLGTNVIVAMMKREMVPPPPPEDATEGWYRDPTGRFDLRLWNGKAWTFHAAREADKSTHRDPPTMRQPSEVGRQ